MCLRTGPASRGSVSDFCFLLSAFFRVPQGLASPHVAAKRSQMESRRNSIHQRGRKWPRCGHSDGQRSVGPPELFVCLRTGPASHGSVSDFCFLLSAFCFFSCAPRSGLASRGCSAQPDQVAAQLDPPLRTCSRAETLNEPNPGNEPKRGAASSYIGWHCRQRSNPDWRRGCCQCQCPRGRLHASG